MTKGYNRYNFLLKVKAVNELYLERIAAGDTVIKEIFSEYIYPRWLISRSTFYNYLAIPYKRELDKLSDKKEDTQLKIFE